MGKGSSRSRTLTQGLSSAQDGSAQKSTRGVPLRKAGAPALLRTLSSDIDRRNVVVVQLPWQSVLVQCQANRSFTHAQRGVSPISRPPTLPMLGRVQTEMCDSSPDRWAGTARPPPLRRCLPATACTSRPLSASPHVAPPARLPDPAAVPLVYCSSLTRRFSVAVVLPTAPTRPPGPLPRPPASGPACGCGLPVRPGLDSACAAASGRRRRAQRGPPGRSGSEADGTAQRPPGRRRKRFSPFAESGRPQTATAPDVFRVSSGALLFRMIRQFPGVFITARHRRGMRL